MKSNLPLVVLIAVLALFFTVRSGWGQGTVQSEEDVYVVRAAHLIDGWSDGVRHDVAVLVKGGRIVQIGSPQEIARQAPSEAHRIDLGDATLLPGLIDAHTHLLLQGDITAADYDEQVLKESIP